MTEWFKYVEFQLKDISGNMRCKLHQKRSTGKTSILGFSLFLK